MTICRAPRSKRTADAAGGGRCSLFRSIAPQVEAFRFAEAFLATPESAGPACLVLDARLRGQSGLALQNLLLAMERAPLPVVFLTGHGDIAMTVEAMKAGAVDFLTKPFRDQDMIDAVVAALRNELRHELRQGTSAWGRPSSGCAFAHR